MMINADYFTSVDKDVIPSGEIQSVKGTPFDFLDPTLIGARINQDNQQLKFGSGYDHNFILRESKEELRFAVKVQELTTGRVMEVWTSEPGVQFYSGNVFDGSGSITGKGGVTYPHRAGFCLETQHYPDSPNKSNFPSTVLNPGETYRSTTQYIFSVSD